MNCCGECKYNKRNWSQDGYFYCSNVDSDNYGYSTAYSDSCDDYEEKE